MGIWGCSVGPAYAFLRDVGWAHHMSGVSASLAGEDREAGKLGSPGPLETSLASHPPAGEPSLVHVVAVSSQTEARKGPIAEPFPRPYIFKSLPCAKAPLAKFMRSSPDPSGGEISSASWM